MDHANPWTRLSLPVSLNDLLEARDQAIRLHNDARRLNEQVRETLSVVGSYLMPHGGEFKDSLERALIELDQSMWRRAFDLTGFTQIMDAEAVSEFERSLYPKPPDFTDATIRATFIDLHQKAGHMFRRGIVNVFRYLSDDYKTNAKEKFRVGRKCIMSCMVGPSFKRGLQIRYGSGDRLNDIDRIIKTVDGKQFKPRDFEYAMNAAFEKQEVYECDYYRAKGFNNGNLHLEFKRADLLELLNEQIAIYYGENVLA